jgi:DNA-binding GntR family transcriptional regulator
MTKLDLQIAPQRATLRGQVEEKLRQAIALGVFTPGQRLIERELCERLGVGRTSVREALRQLEAEGLITSVPHRGPVVSTINADEAEQLYAFRALLEGYAGRRCAESTTEIFKQKLEAAVETFVTAAKGQDRGPMLEAKRAFYDLLLEGSGNIFMRQTLGALHNRINMLRLTSMMQPGRLEHSIAELCEIAAAIRAGDGKRAGRACRRHVEEAAKAALKTLRH